MFLAVSLVVGLLVVNAYLPVRRGPLGIGSFVSGWLADELPVHLVVASVAATVALGAAGASAAGVRWWVGLAVSALAWAGLVGLAVTADRSGALVAAALDGLAGADGPPPQPVWLRGWRLVLAVPFRFRSIRRARSYDYWGDGIRRHRLDVITRRGDPPTRAPVMVYVHGGAWVMGNKDSQGLPMLYELAARGWVCVSLNYRLGTRAAWPAQIVDCKRAVAWVREHLEELGGDPDFVAISGGSAGGHLSALVALTPGDPEWQPGFEDADTSVNACVPLYGVYDMAGDPDAMGILGPGFLRFLERTVMRTTRAADPERFDQASPDRRVGAQAPPMFVVHGVDDTLVPLPVARRFVERLRAVSGAPVAAVELPRAQHAFDLLVSVRCRHTTMGVVRFLDAVRPRTARDAPPRPGDGAEPPRPGDRTEPVAPAGAPPVQAPH